MGYFCSCEKSPHLFTIEQSTDDTTTLNVYDI